MTAVNTLNFNLAVTDTNWQIAGVGDFTNDGQADIIWRNYSTGSTVVWQMNGMNAVNTLNFNLAVTDTNWRIEGTGDFTNDGQVDIIWRNYANGLTNVWQMSGMNAVNTLNFNLAVTDTNWRIEGTGNFTSDNQVDIIWRNYANGLTNVWQMSGMNAVNTLNFNLAVTDTNWQPIAPFNLCGSIPRSLLRPSSTASHGRC